MDFKILNQNGTQISNNELDQEAAEFWGVSYEKGWYVTPKGDKHKSTDSWDYNIEMAINNFHSYKPLKGWEKVVYSMMQSHLDYATRIEGGELNNSNGFTDITINVGLNWVISTLQPYINLINHWGQKGYQIIITD